MGFIEGTGLGDSRAASPKKVVLLGAPGVGKTSLVRRYVMNAFDDRYRATLDAVVSKRPVHVRVDRRPVRVTMTLWDTMGAPRAIDAPREVYLLGAQGGPCLVRDLRA